MNKEFETLEDLSRQEIIVKKGIGIYMDGSVQTMPHKTTVGVEFKGHIETLKQALTELKRIKDAKPSEALKDLEELRDFRYGENKLLVCQTEMYTTIKQALLTAQEQNFSYQTIVIPFFDELAQLLGTNDIDEMLDKIKEQHNVLRITKEKRVDEQLIRIADSVKWYNKEYIYRHEIEYLNRSVLLAYQLTQEEFNTLKRWRSTNIVDMKRLNIEEE